MITDADLDRAVAICAKPFALTCSVDEYWLFNVMPEIVAEVRRLRNSFTECVESHQKVNAELEEWESLFDVLDGEETSEIIESVKRLKAETAALRKEHLEAACLLAQAMDYGIAHPSLFSAHRAAQAVLEGKEPHE